MRRILTGILLGLFWSFPFAKIAFVAELKAANERASSVSHLTDQRESDYSNDFKKEE